MTADTIGELRARYWRARFREERAVRLQPVSRSIREGRLARREAREARAELRALGAKP